MLQQIQATPWHYRNLIGKSWPVGILYLFLAIQSAAVKADEPIRTAVEILAAFSGESAEQYESFFQFSDAGRIVSIDIHAVGMDAATARYSGQEPAWHEVNNILRIKTADGFEGVSGVDTYYQGGFSNEHLLELQAVVEDVVALRSLDPVDVSSQLQSMHPDLSTEVRASIDIALWDLAARRANRPMHELLGSKRESMDAYASLPFYESLTEHFEAVHEYAKHGFTAFKFHVWGTLKEDLQLVESVQREFANSDYLFMIDLESKYEYDNALVLGLAMDEGLFEWFEAPVDDELVDQYAMLRDRLSVLIIPAGYNIYSPEFIRRGIEAGAWDAGRFDATVVGGISEALELLVIANTANLPIDVQSWGHSLAQAANLHLMLANHRTRYFEAPMPKQVFEFGMKNGNMIKQGRAIAPDGPGLGIEVDWDRLPLADFHEFSTARYR